MIVSSMMGVGGFEFELGKDANPGDRVTTTALEPEVPI